MAVRRPLVMIAGRKKMLPAGDTFPADAVAPQLSIVASEAIAAGRFFNLWSDSGVLKARLASSSLGRPAHGFVLTDVASGATGVGYWLGAVNTALAGLVIGTNYFLSTTGAVATFSPDSTNSANVGQVAQQLGVATSATTLKTDRYHPVVL